MVTDGAEFVVGNIEKLFKETRQNTRVKHEKWVKYYNKRRREANIRVNDLVLVETHPISSATRKRWSQNSNQSLRVLIVLSARNNVIWKAGRRLTVNIDQVRIYHQRKSDEGVVEVDSSVSSGSEYQSNSLEENRPKLNRSQGFRSSESGERQVEQGEKTSLEGNKSGRREQQVNKRKRSSGFNESSIGLRQQQYKTKCDEVQEKGTFLKVCGTRKKEKKNGNQKDQQKSIEIILHLHHAS
ncbi:uncharacterized protein TNCV_4342091 [Trichonephila clavipes]|nr:uncharacterized protein TNCV_4342091 [Trichonephila clavipes]